MTDHLKHNTEQYGIARRDFRTRTSLRFACALAFFAPCIFAANNYARHNLVSDIPGLADHTDPHLVNPWGMSASPMSPFWISNNHGGTTTLYDGAGQPFPTNSPLVVTIPTPQSIDPPSAPTGQVYNDTGAFAVASDKPALFIFASEDGTISGWNPGADLNNAIVMVDNSGSGAVYKGLAIANTSSRPMLYAPTSVPLPSTCSTGILRPSPRRAGSPIP